MDRVTGTGYGAKTHYFDANARHEPPFHWKSNPEGAPALCSPAIWLTWFSDSPEPDLSLKVRPLCKMCIKKAKKLDANSKA